MCRDVYTEAGDRQGRVPHAISRTFCQPLLQLESKADTIFLIGKITTIVTSSDSPSLSFPLLLSFS